MCHLGPLFVNIHMFPSCTHGRGRSGPQSTTGQLCGLNWFHLPEPQCPRLSNEISHLYHAPACTTTATSEHALFLLQTYNLAFPTLATSCCWTSERFSASSRPITQALTHIVYPLVLSESPPICHPRTSSSPPCLHL